LDDYSVVRLQGGRFPCAALMTASLGLTLFSFLNFNSYVHQAIEIGFSQNVS